MSERFSPAEAGAQARRPSAKRAKAGLDIRRNSRFWSREVVPRFADEETGSVEGLAGQVAAARIGRAAAFQRFLARRQSAHLPGCDAMDAEAQNIFRREIREAGAAQFAD